MMSVREKKVASGLTNYSRKLKNVCCKTIPDSSVGWNARMPKLMSCFRLPATPPLLATLGSQLAVQKSAACREIALFENNALTIEEQCNAIQNCITQLLTEFRHMI